MGRLPSNRKRDPTREPSRSGSPIWKRRSRRRMRLAELMAEHVALKKTLGEL
jgi:hypothetical protein